MEVVQNFDWRETKRNTVVFMPNFNGADLTRASIERIQTVAEPNTYLIIIGNDGVNDDFSDLYNKNVRQITLKRNPVCRNGCFIRNYVIKRCLSELFLQKDAEVVLEGDFLMQARKYREKGFGWRAGNVQALTALQTKQYLSGGLDNTDNVNFRVIEPTQPITDYESVRKYLLNLDGKVNFISYYHYAYCTKTAILQSINGYNENYYMYGWEDVSMYLRLSTKKEIIAPDHQCYAIHLNHPPTVNTKKLPHMKQVFEHEDFWGLANEENCWGNGV
jgi:hypothetical protein